MVHYLEHYSTDHKETRHKDGLVVVPACHFKQLSILRLVARRRPFWGHVSAEKKEVGDFDPGNLSLAASAKLSTKTQLFAGAIATTLVSSRERKKK